MMDGSNTDPLSWREAAKEAMHQATLVEAKRRFGTREPLFNYRWEHVQAVVTLALRLAQLTGADVEIVEAAAWLHDIRKDRKQDHPQAGAAYARQFLPRTDFPAGKIERVAQAIADHMGLWLDEPLTNLESQVLWDADKLSKIGLTSAFHWLGQRFAAGKPQTTSGFYENDQAMEWLPKAVASMHTEPARRAAQARLERYERLWTDLRGELAGADLEHPAG